MASGYDLSSKHPYRLMQGRLGIYGKKPFNPTGSLEGVNKQSIHFLENGGNLQQERMIKDKRRSLDHAVWFSFQAAEIVRVDAEDKEPVKALINPDKVKQDYDEKILSVGYEYNFQPGSVFEWLGTNTYWLCYLQELTELAFFRCNIRRCSYQIQWLDDDGELHSTYCALRGPVETQINYIQKHTISVDTPNFSLNILMPKNKDTLSFFKRYSKFYLTGIEDGDTNICWRVEAVDSLSMPGILEVNAEEYYANETEDDGVLAGNLITKPIAPNSEKVNNKIEGETFIKPKKSYTFEYKGNIKSTWTIDNKKYPVKIESIKDKTISITWTSSYSGQFELSYGPYTKVIVVESLF